MEYLIGFVLAFLVGLTLTFLGMDRDRSLYPTIMIVIASYYVLFAVMGGAQALAMETAIAVVFVGLSLAGFKATLWLVVAALAGHGVFDLVHGHFIQNPGVPVWWPMFCLAFDFAAAVYLAVLLSCDRVSPALATRVLRDVKAAGSPAISD